MTETQDLYFKQEKRTSVLRELEYTEETKMPRTSPWHGQWCLHCKNNWKNLNPNTENVSMIRALNWPTIRAHGSDQQNHCINPTNLQTPAQNPHLESDHRNWGRASNGWFSPFWNGSGTSAWYLLSRSAPVAANGNAGPYTLLSLRRPLNAGWGGGAWLTGKWPAV